MANTIKNIVEILETDEDYGKALENRSHHIANFSTLGPPELIYLTKSFHKSFGLNKSPKGQGFYHYTYGVDLSSAAGISIYISKLLKEQETDGKWFANGKWTITKAVFCVYDIFKKRDVRAEVTIPGGMKLYAINRDEEVVAVDDSQWDTVYMSSVLRALSPQRVPFVKFYRELETKEQLKYFLSTVIDFLQKNELEFENHELISYRGNKLLHYVNDYLIRKRRLSIAVEFFTGLVKKDQRIAAFISDIFSSMFKYPASIKLLSQILVKSPHVSVLLYQEAENLMKTEQYELALKLIKAVIQLCPDSFDAWYLLSEIYFYSKNYSEALVAINMCPFYTKPNHNNGVVTDIKASHIVQPKTNELCNNLSHFMFEPSAEVYRSTQFQEELANMRPEFLEENERLVHHMKNLPASKLDDQELKIYKLLVKLEREVGWDNLLKIRSKLFLMEFDSGLTITNSTNLTKPISFKDKDTTKLEDYDIYEQSVIVEDNNNINFIPGLSMNEQSFYLVKSGGEQMIERYREDVNTDESVDETEMPSFLKNDDDPEASTVLNEKTNKIKENSYKAIQAWEGQRSQKITEVDEEDEENKRREAKEGENKLKKYVEKDYNDIKGTNNFDPGQIINIDTKRKRLCSRTLDTLFIALYEDLNILYDWQHEENMDKSILKSQGNEEDATDEEIIKYNGLVWVNRGILAERLCRLRFAEKAYRRAIEKGVSMYAWSRLFKLYIETGNAKAAIICLAEILDEVENEGVTKFPKLPNWVEEPIIQLISTIGLTKFKQLLVEMNWEDDAMKQLLDQVEYWKVEGTSNTSIDLPKI